MKYEEEGKLAFCFPLEKEVGEFGKGMARGGKQICKKKRAETQNQGHHTSRTSVTFVIAKGPFFIPSIEEPRHFYDQDRLLSFFLPILCIKYLASCSKYPPEML